ncbi:MAG: ribonuclease [Burkholderiales bacterium]|jgi:ribonuclease-3|nr:ribonuclease [Burkholderiales bacterium]
MDILTKLQKALGYKFKDISLLQLALTHRSYSQQNNERLEFVGKGILDDVIGMSLYIRYPNFTEGTLSKIRAALANQDTLAEVAAKIDLGKYLLMTPGEDATGGRSRPSMLARCMEALIAAIALDSSHSQAAKVIESLYTEYLANAIHSISKDFKTTLQEYLQSRKIGLPIYEVYEIEGKDHNMVFHIGCDIPGLKIKVLGQGRSKKEASQSAAERALAQIYKHNVAQNPY